MISWRKGGKNGRVDDKQTPARVQDATDLGESVSRPEEVMEHSDERDDVEQPVIPWQAILRVGYSQIDRGPDPGQLLARDPQNTRRQISAAEVRRSSFGKTFEQPPRGAPDVQDPECAIDGSSQFCDDGAVPKRRLADLHPDARVVARRHLGVITPVTARLVPVRLAEVRQPVHDLLLRGAARRRRLLLQGRLARHARGVTTGSVGRKQPAKAVTATTRLPPS